MKYKISAKAVGYLEEIVEAKSEDDAWKILNDKLEDGTLSELDGWVEGEEVEEVK